MTTPSPLHWQAPDRHTRPLPRTGVRNDASTVAHLYASSDVVEQLEDRCLMCGAER